MFRDHRGSVSALHRDKQGFSVSFFHFKKGLLNFTQMNVFECVQCVATMCVQCPLGSEEDIRGPGTGRRDGCEEPCRCWVLQEESFALLTTEPTPQPPAIMPRLILERQF